MKVQSKLHQSLQTQQYSTSPGNYNRESGRKTLYFVGTLIALVTILSITSLIMINKKSGVLIQSSSTDKTNSSAKKHHIIATPIPSIPSNIQK